MALPRQIILAVGIDHRMRRSRQFAANLMVVEHHHIGAGSLRRLDRRRAVGAAIHRDDQRCLPRQLLHRCRIGAVTFKNPVRDVNPVGNAVMGQEPRQDRRRTGAIHVIITENRHVLVPGNGSGDALCRPVHIGQRGGIRHQALDRRLHEGSRLVEADTPARQNPRHQSGKPWFCAMASAMFASRCPSRSIHFRPVADCSTPRKSRSDIIQAFNHPDGTECNAS